MSRTPQRVKLLDAFMAFLVAVGVLQFAYCVVGGNYVRFFVLFVAPGFSVVVRRGGSLARGGGWGRGEEDRGN